jgi:hypothetical protein
LGAQLLNPLAVVLAVAALALLVVGWIRLVRFLRSVQPAAAGTAPLSASPAIHGRSEIGRVVLSLTLLAAAFFLIIQLVPVNRTNPPVQTTIQWDSQQTKDLASRACMDCHSNETTWPWYAQFAPGSWLTALHVQDGRERLNFSEMGTGSSSRSINDIGEQIQRGSMPPADYMILHPAARLTDAEKQLLIQGLETSLSR